MRGVIRISKLSDLWLGFFLPLVWIAREAYALDIENATQKKTGCEGEWMSSP